MQSVTATSLSASQEHDFNQWARRLHGLYDDAFGKAEKKKPRRPRKAPENAFKLAAYEYMWLVDGQGLYSELVQFLDGNDGKGWRRNSGSLATAVVRLATIGMRSARTRQIRSRTAFDLRLAWINQVRPELLIGFLLEAGSEAVIKEDVGRNKRYAWAKHYGYQADS